MRSVILTSDDLRTLIELVENADTQPGFGPKSTASMSMLRRKLTKALAGEHEAVAA
jgi:hypothetical protein